MAIGRDVSRVIGVTVKNFGLALAVISHLRAFYPLPADGTGASFVWFLGLRSWAIAWAITIRIYEGIHTHSPVTCGLAGDAIPRSLM